MNGRPVERDLQKAGAGLRSVAEPAPRSDGHVAFRSPATRTMIGVPPSLSLLRLSAEHQDISEQFALHHVLELGAQVRIGHERGFVPT